MAPNHSRHLLTWTLPAIAIVITYFWYKKKRIGNKSHLINNSINQKEKEKESDNTVAITTTAATATTITNTKILTLDKSIDEQTTNKSFSRSLSGVDTAPIDIIIPYQLKSSKITSVIISDEDLDIEIEKIKSMRYSSSSSIDIRNKLKQNSLSSTTTTTTKSLSPNNQGQNNNNSSNNHSNNNNSNIESDSLDKSTMAQKEITLIKEKFTNLSLSPVKKSPTNKLSVSFNTTNISNNNNNNDNNDNNDNNNNKNNKNKNNINNKKKNKSMKESNQNNEKNERDSANHSPVDVMLASPSLSCISDNQSEESNDSGKGGSDMATPPPSTQITVNDHQTIDIITPIEQQVYYDFTIPQNLVGKLIGKSGCFVTQIRDTANTQIVVKKHPTNNKLKLCVLQGYRNDVDNALKMIRDKFPLKKFPEVTLEQVTFVEKVTTIPLVPDHLYLKLVEGINNDTIVSCMVSPIHLFLQQPAHPTFPNLSLLSEFMNLCYNESDSPLLPDPIPDNTICVAYSVGTWCRAIVLSTDIDRDCSYVKFLDYGGYAYVENSQLRQIRGDFMLLPFQAAECFLANIKPTGDESGAAWPQEAYTFVAELTKGALIYTQIVDYTEEFIPLVHCYVVNGPQQLIFLNEALVSEGFADWIQYDIQQDSQLVMGQEQFINQPQNGDDNLIIEENEEDNEGEDGAVGITVIPSSSSSFV